MSRAPSMRMPAMQFNSLYARAAECEGAGWDVIRELMAQADFTRGGMPAERYIDREIDELELTVAKGVTPYRRAVCMFVYAWEWDALSIEQQLRVWQLLEWRLEESPVGRLE